METILHYSKYFKTIMHSKRANIFYLEHCRVLVKDQRVEYLTPENDCSRYWNIPIANTTCLLLGNGTSITNTAVRYLSQAGVMIGFCGGGSTPLFSGNDIEWFTPQNEYRPTEYIQNWLSFWFDDVKRVEAGKLLQLKRIEYFEKIAPKLCGRHSDDIISSIYTFKNNIKDTKTQQDLLLLEARYIKKLYSLFATKYKLADFKRDNEADDNVNIYLNHGNYLCYGLASTATWVLGIPHGFALLHGKTRKGALVFDIADLIKDSLILPQAFISAIENNDSESQFRHECLNNFITYNAMDFMFNTIKEICDTFGVIK